MGPVIPSDGLAQPQFKTGKLQLKPGPLRSGLQHLDLLQALRGSTGRPNLNGALLRKKQPLQSGAIALIVSHFST